MRLFAGSCRHTAIHICTTTTSSHEVKGIRLFLDICDGGGIIATRLESPTQLVVLDKQLEQLHVGVE